MNGELSKRARRFAVVVNYASVLLFAAIFCIGEYGRWTVSLVVIEIIASVLAAVSLYVALIRTDLWRLTHTDAERLDEREIQVTHTSFRRSYAFLSVLSLAIVAFMTVSVRFAFFTLTHRGHYSLGLIAILCLSYLVQTLPASILAWTEREVAGR